MEADDWTLVISEARAEDSGQYECSLNTRPRLSSRVSLRVEDTAAVDQEQVRSRGLGRFDVSIFRGQTVEKEDCSLGCRMVTAWSWRCRVWGRWRE